MRVMASKSRSESASFSNGNDADGSAVLARWVKSSEKASCGGKIHASWVSERTSAWVPLSGDGASRCGAWADGFMMLVREDGMRKYWSKGAWLVKHLSNSIP